MAANELNNNTRQAIGYVVGGGLKANLFVRLTVPAQSVQEGGFVVLESGNWLFYGLVVDLLPARPPLTLDSIYPCSGADLARFCADGRFGYLRHLLRDQDIPAAELLAVHLREVLAVNGENGETAVETVIAMLKDDYPQLMDVLSAVSEVF